MIYKCKGCGGAVRFNTEKQKLVCDFCGAEYDASGYEETLGQNDLPYETMEQKVYSCSACGAKLMINDVEAASFCAYCGQPTIVFDRVSKVRKPDIILPFKVTREEAHGLITEKLNGYFIPPEIRNIELNVVRGIYIPFSFSNVDYEDRQYIKGKVRSGKNSVTKYFFRHARAKFDFLPVDQSIKFNDDSAERLEPFPKEAFTKFDASYLSGFYADCGDEKQDDLNAKARYRAKTLFDKKMLASVKADSKTLIRTDSNVNIETSQYGMLPVWFFACSHNGATYTIMVNGYTGKVVGAMPFDKKKVAICSAIVGIPLSAAFGIACGFIMSYVWEFADDSDDIVSVFKIAGVAIMAIFGAALAKLKAFKKSRKLTMESDIFELAKDRQEV